MSWRSARPAQSSRSARDRRAKAAAADVGTADDTSLLELGKKTIDELRLRYIKDPEFVHGTGRELPGPRGRSTAIRQHSR